VDAQGTLYVADRVNDRIERRDAMARWLTLATTGEGPGQVLLPSALAVDTAGNLYVADQRGGGRVQKRDPQGHWSTLAGAGAATGQVRLPSALVLDAAGNLYVSDQLDEGRIQKRDIQGNWSVIARRGAPGGVPIPGLVFLPNGLAVDTAGNLYVADTGNYRVQKYTPAP
jgi:sugar lactone lactonase YvrE